MSGAAFTATEVKRALTMLAKSTDKRSDIAALRSVRMEFTGNTVTMSTTTLDVCQSVTLTGDGSAEGVHLVECKALQDAVKVAKGRGAVVAFTATSDGLAVTAGAMSMTLPDAASVSKWPRQAWDGDSAPFTLDAAALADVLPACGRDKNRPALTGVQVTEHGDYTATDSYHLHTYRSDQPGPVGGVILPREAAALIAKHVHDGKHDVNVSARLHGPDVGSYTSAQWVVANVGEWQVAARCIDATYPDWERLIRVKSPGRIVFAHAPGAATILRDVAKMCDAGTPVRFDPVDDGNYVAVTDNAGIRSTYGITVDVAHDDGARHTYAFNPAYLADLLTGLGDGQVTFGVVDSLKSAMLHAGPRRRILMPVKI